MGQLVTRAVACVVALCTPPAWAQTTTPDSQPMPAPATAPAAGSSATSPPPPAGTAAAQAPALAPAPGAPAATIPPAAAPTVAASAPAPQGFVQPGAFERLQYINTKIAQLEEEQSNYSLGGPITMTAIGGGTLLVSLYVLLIIESYENTCEVGDLTDCGENDETRNAAYTAALIGTGLTAGGLVWLFNRIPKRRAIGRQIDELEKERLFLRHQVGIAPQLGPHLAGLRLYLAF